MPRRYRHSRPPAPRSIVLAAPPCAPPSRRTADGVRQKTHEFHPQERQLRRAHIRRAIRENSRNACRRLSVYRLASAKQREHAPPLRLRQELGQEIVRHEVACRACAAWQRSTYLPMVLIKLSVNSVVLAVPPTSRVSDFPSR